MVYLGGLAESTLCWWGNRS